VGAVVGRWVGWGVREGALVGFIEGTLVGFPEGAMSGWHTPAPSLIEVKVTSQAAPTPLCSFRTT